MMDKLEKFILENREKFDKNQPSPEIGKRLSSVSFVKTKAKSRYLFILSRVAAVVLIFVLSYMVHEYRDYVKDRENAGMMGIYRQFPELRETEVYYNHLVSGKLQKMKHFLEKNPMIAGEITY